MRRYLVLLALSLFSFFFSSCANDNEENGSKPVLNFLGDSIIENWTTVYKTFPDYECNNLGWSGKGIDSFLGRIDISTLAGTDCVVEIGTNDMGVVIKGNRLEEYALHYVEILKSLKARRIYLFSLIPRNREKDGRLPYNANYIVFNKNIQELTQAEMSNVVYVPVFDAFIKDGEINWDYTYDGLHPNQQGYDVMARELRKYLVKESSSIQ